MTVKIVQTDAAPAAIGPYSQATIAGGFLFASGQIPLRADGTLVEGEIEAQAEQVLTNLKAVLAAAGASLNHVAKSTVFLSDFNDFARFNAIYEKAFGAHKPARSTFQVARLPRDVKIEIEVIAKLD